MSSTLHHRLAVYERLCLTLGPLLLLAILVAPVRADVFTYQGELRQDGVLAADGMYDFEFRLMSGIDGFGLTQPIPMTLPVIGGRFTAEIDIPSFVNLALIDDGDQQIWLEISVDGNVLSPLQPMRPAPVASFALGPWRTNEEANVYFGPHAPGGFVGIGNDDPQAMLHVGDEFGDGFPDWMAGPGLNVARTTDNAFFGLKYEGLNRADTVIAWGDDASESLRFINALHNGPPEGTELMRLESSGRLGVGTDVPEVRLHVNGGIRARGGPPGDFGLDDNGYAFAGNGGDNDSGLFSSADGQLELYANASEIVRVTSSDVDLYADTNVIGTLFAGGIGVPHTAARFTGTRCGAATHDNHVVQVTNYLDPESQIACGFSTPDVMSLRIYEHFETDLTAGNNFITFRYASYGNADESVGAIQGNGAGGVMLAGPGNDFAEWIPSLEPFEEFESGDVVGVVNGKITKQTVGALIVMVMSTAPIILGNRPGEDDDEPFDAVAFVGQALVKVVGPVTAGDFIVPSGLNDGTGIAVASEMITARQAQQIVGQAWATSHDPDMKLVNTAVGLSWHDPLNTRLLSTIEEQAKRIEQLESTVASLVALGERLEVALAASVAAESAARLAEAKGD